LGVLPLAVGNKKVGFLALLSFSFLVAAAEPSSSLPPFLSLSAAALSLALFFSFQALGLGPRLCA
jgi:hypothetical protein